MTIREAKSFGLNELENFSPSAALDTNCFLENILECDKTFLLLHANDSLPAEKEVSFKNAVEKRKTGLPVAYITNHKEFFGYDFFVTPDVLIPKPDTEILVENAAKKILHTLENDAASNQKKITRICDMCSGSGCIGLAVYLSVKNVLPKNVFLDITFADISQKALDISKKNAEKLCSPKIISENEFKTENAVFHFVKTNLFEKINNTDRFDFILTNPPYIPSKLVDELLTDGRNEPRLALDGDVNSDSTPDKNSSDGLSIIRRLIPQIKTNLSDGGFFFMETGEYNAEETASMCRKIKFQNVIILNDLEGQQRVVIGQK